MKLIFIGSGSAFTVGDGNYQSNMILESDSNRRLLIDCGSDARLALNELGLSYRDIDAVYISHLHSDHCGGLEWLAFCKKFDKSCSKPLLYLHPDLLTPLWNHLAPGLTSLKEDNITLSTFFDVRPVQNCQFLWENIPFHLFLTVHIERATDLMPCYGLQFEVADKRILITTDTQFVPDRYRELYEQSDVIFHDCEISPNKSGVHAHYSELKTLHPELKKKMWLYHTQPIPLPNALLDGFRGFVKKGQSFVFES